MFLHIIVRQPLPDIDSYSFPSPSTRQTNRVNDGLQRTTRPERSLFVCFGLFDERLEESRAARRRRSRVDGDQRRGRCQSDGSRLRAAADLVARPASLSGISLLLLETSFP